MFRSGYAPTPAHVDLDVLLSQGRHPWNQSIGQNTPVWNNRRYDGASVFFARLGALQDVVVRLGGATGPTPGSTTTDTAEFLLNGTWTALPAIPGGPRTDLNVVILPDASVLVIGGAADHSGTPVLTTALWRPGMGVWEILPDTPAPRGYHATAVLLADGRVLVGGGDKRSPSDRDFHVFSPAYVTDAVRPVIVDVKDQTGASIVPDPDGTFPLSGNMLSNPGFLVDCTVQGMDSIDKVVLMAPGSITHHSDMTARYVELPSASAEATSRMFWTPDSRTLPRGYYMMFAISSGNIPSEAVWVKIT